MLKDLTIKFRPYSMANKKGEPMVKRVKRLMHKLKKQRMKKKERRLRKNQRKLSVVSSVFGIFGHQNKMMKRKEKDSRFLMLHWHNRD